MLFKEDFSKYVSFEKAKTMCIIFTKEFLLDLELKLYHLM